MNDMTQPTSGLILFAHGARDPRWATPFESVAQRLHRMQPALLVRLAFLEFMAPSLADAAAELVGVGCQLVTVQPMFLGAGGHVRKDLPLLVDALRANWPDVRFTVAQAIGEMEVVLQAMAAAALQASAESAPS